MAIKISMMNNSGISIPKTIPATLTFLVVVLPVKRVVIPDEVARLEDPPEKIVELATETCLGLFDMIFSLKTNKLMYNKIQINYFTVFLAKM